MKSSNIVLLKSKFFILRAVIYSSFLMIPILAQKSLDLTIGAQLMMMLLYTFFMAGQWFMLGKEIDHRFKIYFRTNSSIDRVIYRLLLGMFVMLIYFNFLSFFPGKWIYNMFWVTWVVLGLFYSWPTRGKIIRESVTTNFSEFKYLDSFEKTLLGFILLMVVVSIPEFPTLTNHEALKLFFDPMERLSGQWWNFLMVNYYPFKSYPELFRLAWSMHFYLVGMGLFLLTFYALLRYFVSRRLSLLGVFILVSSWSYVKIISNNYGDAIATTFTLLWVWGLLWSAKAASYRIGFGLGLLGYYGVLLDPANSLLLFIQIPMSFYLMLPDKTKWFKLKLIRYLCFGLLLSVLYIVSNWEQSLFAFLPSWEAIYNKEVLANLFSIFERKAFFTLAPIGAIFLWLKLKSDWHRFGQIVVDRHYYTILFHALTLLIVGTLFFSPYWMKSFGWLWCLTLLSLIPLEFLFQATFRLRSKRNIIYLTYILIALLDSHLENRLKQFYQLFF